MTTASIANNAYQMAAKLQQQARAMEDTAPEDTEAVDFGKMVQEAVGDVVDKGHVRPTTRRSA